MISTGKCRYVGCVEGGGGAGECEGYYTCKEGMIVYFNIILGRGVEGKRARRAGWGKLEIFIYKEWKIVDFDIIFFFFFFFFWGGAIYKGWAMEGEGGQQEGVYHKVQKIVYLTHLGGKAIV